jgi:hypothetical protein
MTKATFDDETREWSVPAFVLKANQISFPKMKGDKGNQFSDNHS